MGSSVCLNFIGLELKVIRSLGYAGRVGVWRTGAEEE
jgi:hypothetical protein